MPAEPAVRVALVTAPDKGTASSLARTVVEERLAACVNLLDGATSVYRWEGRVEEDAEVLMICKTTPESLGALAARILELHPYDTPEFVVLNPEWVEPRYAAWLAGAAAPGRGDTDASAEGAPE